MNSHREAIARQIKLARAWFKYGRFWVSRTSAISPLGDGGEFTRKDVKSMQGAVRHASPQLRSG
ncbi:MAG: hypothetical protein JF606_28450 [Burkholderiales bacterium]|jgi:hypothetical protein|nr:hypothetical protein [Burkholderiales bacterium]